MPTTNDLNFILTLLLMWVVLGTCIFFSIMAQKNKIRNVLKEKGASPINISWMPLDFNRSYHTYSVEYEDSSGEKHITTCKMLIFRSIIDWENEI